VAGGRDHPGRRGVPGGARPRAPLRRPLGASRRHGAASGTRGGGGRGARRRAVRHRRRGARERGGGPTPQHRALEHRGGDHLAVREPPARRAVAAARLDRASGARGRQCQRVRPGRRVRPAPDARRCAAGALGTLPPPGVRLD
jgi:hypothetical protein